MTAALHNLKRIVSTDGHPREARRTEIVERDGLAGCVAREEVRAHNSSSLKVELQPIGERADGGHSDNGTAPSRLGLERLEEREDRWLDRDAARGLRLRRFRPPPPSWVSTPSQEHPLAWRRKFSV